MPLPPAVDKLLQDVDKQLHEKNAVTNLLTQVEARTGIKRLHLILGGFIHSGQTIIKSLFAL